MPEDKTEEKQNISGTGTRIDWSTSNFSITPSNLQALCDQAGLGISIDPIDLNSVVKRIGNNYKRKVRGQYEFQSKIVKTGDSDKTIISVAIWEQDEITEESKAEHVNRLVWDNISSLWLDTGLKKVDENAPADEQRTQAAIIAATSYLLGAIRHDQKHLNSTQLYCLYLKSYLSDKCMAVGVFNHRCKPYYIGPGFEEENFQKFLSFMGKLTSYSDKNGQRWLFDCTYPSTQTAINNAEQGISCMVEELQEKMSVWRNSKNNVRGDALAERIAEFNDIKSFAGLFSDALECQMESLTSDFDKCQSMIDQAIKYRDAGASPRLIKVFQRLIDRHDDNCPMGFVIPSDALLNVSKVKKPKIGVLCATALKAPSYYSPSGLGGKALKACGYQGRLIETKAKNFDEVMEYDLVVMKLAEEENPEVEANS